MKTYSFFTPKIWGNKVYFFFNPAQGNIYLIKNTVKIWNIITIWNNCFLSEYILKYNLFLWYKAEFSASFNMNVVLLLFFDEYKAFIWNRKLL